MKVINLLEENKLFRRIVTLALFVLFAFIAVYLTITGADASKLQILSLTSNVFLISFLGYQATRVFEFIKKGK